MRPGYGEAERAHEAGVSDHVAYEPGPLERATLQELILELVLRGDDLPEDMTGARGILRGTCAMLLRQLPADTLGKRRSEDNGLPGFPRR